MSESWVTDSIKILNQYHKFAYLNSDLEMENMQENKYFNWFS